MPSDFEIFDLACVKLFNKDTAHQSNSDLAARSSPNACVGK